MFASAPIYDVDVDKSDICKKKNPWTIKTLKNWNDIWKEDCKVLWWGFRQPFYNVDGSKSFVLIELST